MLLDLTGKKILVTGIANNRSIAWGIAQQLRAAGAELGITYLPDDKGRFEAKVRELTAPLEPSLFLPLNVQDAAQMESVFSEIEEKWGVLDGLVARGSPQNLCSTMTFLINLSTSELNTQVNPTTCLGDTDCWIQQVTAPTLVVTCWIQQCTCILPSTCTGGRSSPCPTRM